jgi:hypothetical protein
LSAFTSAEGFKVEPLGLLPIYKDFQVVQCQNQITLNSTTSAYQETTIPQRTTSAYKETTIPNGTTFVYEKTLISLLVFLILIFVF